MFKRIVVVMMLLAIVSSCGFKNRSGYFYDNHRFNYVKLEKFKGAEGKVINHPYTFDEAQMSTLLSMIEIKKGTAFSGDEKFKNVFDSYAVARLAPNAVKAFAEATPEQRVGFSFLVKAPYVVLKNDRLSDGWMWVEDGQLHIEFNKLYVKVTGDTDKRGYQSQRLAENARGLRTSLDLGPGQQYGDSTKELIIQQSTYVKLAEEKAKREAELAQKGVDESVKVKVIRDKSAQARLKELDTLKKQKMITEEEYEMKRKQILGDL